MDRDSWVSDELLDVLRNGRVYVRGEIFAVVKSRRTYSDAFSNIVDRDEITVVIDQTKVDAGDIVDIERDWKILTFDMLLPFGLVGFLAFVANALAEGGISIFVVSAYSTDHILVKERDLPKAKMKLEEVGCEVVE